MGQNDLLLALAVLIGVLLLSLLLWLLYKLGTSHKSFEEILEEQKWTLEPEKQRSNVGAAIKKEKDKKKTQVKKKPGEHKPGEHKPEEHNQKGSSSSEEEGVVGKRGGWEGERGGVVVEHKKVAHKTLAVEQGLHVVTGNHREDAPMQRPEGDAGQKKKNKKKEGELSKEMKVSTKEGELLKDMKGSDRKNDRELMTSDLTTVVGDAVVTDDMHESSGSLATPTTVFLDKPSKKKKNVGAKEVDAGLKKVHSGLKDVDAVHDVLVPVKAATVQSSVPVPTAHIVAPVHIAPTSPTPVAVLGEVNHAVSVDNKRKKKDASKKGKDMPSSDSLELNGSAHTDALDSLAHKIAPVNSSETSSGRKQVDDTNNNQLRGVQDQLLLSNKKTNELRQELFTTQQKFATLEKNYHDQLSAKVQETEGLKARIQQSHDQHMSELSRLNSQLSAYKQTSGGSSAGAAGSDNTAQIQLINQLNNDNQQLKDTAIRFQQEVQELRQQMRFREDALGSTSKQLASAENNRKTLEGKLKQADEQARNAELRLRELEASNSKKLREANDDLSSLQAQMKSQGQEQLNLSNKLKEKDAEINRLSRELESVDVLFAPKLAQLEQQMQDKNLEIQALKAKRDENLQTTSNSNNSAADLVENGFYFKSNEAELSEARKNLEKSGEDLEHLCSALEQKSVEDLKQLRSALEQKSHEDLEQLRSALEQKSHADLEQKLAQYESITGELDQLKKTKMELDEQLQASAGVTEELNKSKQEYAALERAHNEKLAELARLTEELNAARPPHEGGEEGTKNKEQGHDAEEKRDEELERLKACLSEKCDELDRLRSEHTAFHQAELERVLSEQSRSFSELSAQCEQQLQQQEQQQLLLQQHEQKQQQQQQIQHELTAQYEQQLAENQRIENVKTELEQQLNQLQQQFEQHKQQHHSQEHEQQQLQQLEQQLNALKEGHEQEIKPVKERYEEDMKAVKDSHQDLLSSRSEVDTSILSLELEERREKVAQLENLNEKISEECRRLTEQLNVTQASSTQNEEMSTLSDKLSELSRDFERQGAEKGELERIREDMKLEIQTLRDQLDSLRQAPHDVGDGRLGRDDEEERNQEREELERSREEIIRLERLIEDLKQQQQTTVTTTEDSQDSEVHKLLEETERYKHDILGAERISVERGEELERVRQELESLRLANNELSDRLRNLADQRSEQDDVTGDNVNKENERREDETERLRAELTDKIQELERLQQQQQHDDHQRPGDNEDVERIARELSEAQESKNQLQDEVERYKSILVNTESLLTKLQSNVETEEEVWKQKLLTADNQLQESSETIRKLEARLRELEAERENATDLSNQDLLNGLSSPAVDHKEPSSSRKRLSFYKGKVGKVTGSSNSLSRGSTGARSDQLETTSRPPSKNLLKGCFLPNVDDN